jgi:uncharacterized protein YbjT (DUF2867 family)
MDKARISVVTGAFSYSGKYIAQKLIEKGQKVRTISNHCAPEPGVISEVCPYQFDSPQRLARAFDGADVFYNTYWVRFPYKGTSYEQAVENNKVLINAAKIAGVKRIVNISITNPGLNSSFPYFRGKAQVDQAVMDSGLSYAIIRPTIIFGLEDILINNIAWLLRKFPVFAVPGRGDYKVQPVFVEDLARIATAAGGEDKNLVMDAVGPEIFTFADMVRLIAQKIKRRVMVMPVPAELFILLSKFFNPLLGDIILTRDEVYGLMANLLVSNQAPTGKIKLSDWLEQNSETVGKKYSSELQRHYK